MSVAVLALLVACGGEPPPPPPVAPRGPDPAWPTVLAEAQAPAGHAWQTLRHERVHARLLVPTGATVTDSAPGEEEAFVEVAHRAVTARLTFSPHGAWSAPAADPAQPTTVVDTELPDGGLRVTGYGRGVQCVVTLGPFDRASRDAARTVCGSVRPPPLGAWTRRDDGSDVPAGAWVEPKRPDMVGDSLLGVYAPRLYAGWFGLTQKYCPTDYATLEATADGESSVTVTRADSPAGPAYVRQSRATRQGVTFASGTRVVAPRADGCCFVELFPLGEPASDAEVSYAVALCDTTHI